MLSNLTVGVAVDKKSLRRGTRLMIRMTGCLLLAFCLQVSATGLSQRITLKVNNAPLRKVFDEVSKQTGVSIVYNENLLKVTRPVTLDVKDVTIKELMGICLKGQPLSFEIVNDIVFVKKMAIAPSPEERRADTTGRPGRDFDLRGKVTAENGDILAGATITVKGSGQVAVADGKGDFILKGVEDHATIVVSSVGMQTVTVTLKGRGEVFIRLKVGTSSLDETVVTAFGIQKSAKELGYSVATVKGEDITKANTGNLLSGLTGRVSGLNIASQSPDLTPQMKVLLRGIRSFSPTSNNQPLFVLNGSPLSFGSDVASASLILDFINNINPNDIDNVTVLKGANATALYGPEGVNGVIIINTKKGQKGKPLINFRSSASFQHIDYRPVKYEQRQFGSGTGLLDANGNGIYSSVINNGWGPEYDGGLRPLGRPDEKGVYQMVKYADTKDKRRFFNTASTIQNNLSISQGDDLSSLYMGLGYNAQKGLQPGDQRNNLNLFISGKRKMGPIETQFNINYYRQLNDVGPEGFAPSGPTFVPFRKYKDYNNYEWADLNHYWDDIAIISPYQAVAIDRKKLVENSGIFSLELSGRPLSWLTIRETPTFILRNVYYKQTHEPLSFSDWAKQNGGYNRFFDKLATLAEDNQTNAGINNRFMAIALNKAGDFNFRTILGNEIKENRAKDVQGGSQGLTIPVYNLAFSNQPPTGSEIYVLSRSYSLFGSSSIAYKQRAFLELTARNDWDSKRATVARGKDLYIGGNVSVLMQEVMPSLKRLSWLSGLQLRAALNTTANMNIEPYQSERTLELDYANGFPYQGVVSYGYIPGNPNPYLKPEKVLSFEGGFRTNLWKDLISVDFAYYWQRNNGVIMPVTVPWFSGAPTLDNLGIVNNYGWEADINLNSIIKTTRGFNLSAGFRVAFNKNKVKYLSPVYGNIFPLLAPGGKDGYYGLVARKGHEAFEYWVYDLTKDPQGRVIVDKNTGSPTPDLQHPIYTGNSSPTFTGGFNLNFNYKRFGLSTLNEFSLGAQHYFASGESGTRSGLTTFTTYNDRKPFVLPNSVYLDGTGKYVENTNVKVQSPGQNFYNTYAYSSIHYLASANFLKVKEIVFSYEQQFNTKSVKKLNIGIYGRNLFNFYAKNNLYGDPQLIKGPGRYSGGSLGTLTGGSVADPGGVNGSGSGADQYTPSGLVEYGIILTVSF